MKSQNLYKEIEPVVKGGYCVGCGVCAVVSPESVSIQRNDDGSCEAKVVNREQAEKILGGVCPFSDSGTDENTHSKVLYSDAPFYDVHLGRVHSAWAGHVNEGGFRKNGSSGGMTSWVIHELLRNKSIEAVVHVHAKNSSDGEMFSYSVSRTQEEVEAGAKTRYFSVSMDKALKMVRDEKLRIALVGVPCFIKAARNLAKVDSLFNSLLVYTLSLVCGHMKSAGFAESLAWQAGVKPQNIKTVDFRVKQPGVPANQYAFSVNETKSKKVHTKQMSAMVGRRWDGGYFRLKACDFCDDVVGETADASFGDAWLPEYSGDSEGTNIVIIRSKAIEKIIETGQDVGQLALNKLEFEKAVASQAGGFRDRREGLRYRLYLADKAGVWRPKKRYDAEFNHITNIRKITYRLRQLVRKRSFSSWNLSKKVNSIAPYKLEMTLWHAIFRLVGIVEKKLK